VVYTDGVRHGKLLSISFQKNSIVIAQCHCNFHKTYHKNGYLHQKSDDGTIELPPKRAPIKDFKNTEHMGMFLFPARIKLDDEKTTVKKADSIFYIDKRTLPENSKIIGISINLVEPNRWDLISKAFPSSGYTFFYQIITKTKPWLVLQFSSLYKKKFCDMLEKAQDGTCLIFGEGLSID